MDYFLQNWRSRMAEKYICPGDVLLDIGCYDGSFLAKVQDRVSCVVGLDIAVPLAVVPEVQDRLIVADISAGLPFPDGIFDVVSLLAVFEHLQNNEFVVPELSRLLRPGGRVVLTVPGGYVDRVLDLLIAIGMADGMSLEEHHGYQAADTPPLFEKHGFALQSWRRFQLGLNNLFVFYKL